MKTGPETLAGGGPQSPPPNIKDAEAARIAQEILAEKEYQPPPLDLDALTARFSAAIKEIAAKDSCAFEKAALIIIPTSGRRDFIVLIDPEANEAAAELRRLAEAGERSPLETFLRDARLLEP